MMNTADIFEFDNFSCEFQGKSSGEIGSYGLIGRI